MHPHTLDVREVQLLLYWSPRRRDLWAPWVLLVLWGQMFLKDLWYLSVPWLPCHLEVQYHDRPWLLEARSVPWLQSILGVLEALHYLPHQVTRPGLRCLGRPWLPLDPWVQWLQWLRYSRLHQVVP